MFFLELVLSTPSCCLTAACPWSEKMGLRTAAVLTWSTLSEQSKAQKADKVVPPRLGNHVQAPDCLDS